MKEPNRRVADTSQSPALMLDEIHFEESEVPLTVNMYLGDDPLLSSPQWTS
jgi:hypothetical protein